nr:PREDICTED: interleukin-1 receptor-associated kinase-like 2 [Latimeria chalumnae]|eukprot:XP_014350204.1 PREDICTED: interleukin-1 receptor-associated kinase-like 2 [Latimeria chalumnae]
MADLHNLTSVTLYEIPAHVLEDFCKKMDCLDDRDWMQFASRIITDQTELRLMKSLEKTGRSLTRELIWWWGVRLATVQNLLDLLQELKLYRAAKVLLDWKMGSHCTPQLAMESPGQRGKMGKPNGNKTQETTKTDCTHPGRCPGKLPGPPPPPVELISSLQPNHNPEDISVSIQSSCLNYPEQETDSTIENTTDIVWHLKDCKNATDQFSGDCKICDGTYAYVYKGQKVDTLYAIKRLKQQEECMTQRTIQKFFHTELQIRYQCSHSNILELLGCCAENEEYCLIYQFMPNGSLEDRLQCYAGSEPISWETRISISVRVARAVQFLHSKRIVHGNIKSSNILLDEYFTPKLGNSGLRLELSENGSQYTNVKTKALSKCFAYFSEDFIRHQQVTEKVDIFAYGIKDLIAEEVNRSKKQMSGKGKQHEEVSAKELVQKYLDTKAGPCQTNIAVQFASLVCLCVRKKQPTISEVCEITETLELQVKNQPLHRQTPEDDQCSLEEQRPSSVPDKITEQFNSLILSSGNGQTTDTNGFPLQCKNSTHLNGAERLRMPCESDESDSFEHISPTAGACGDRYNASFPAINPQKGNLSALDKQAKFCNGGFNNVHQSPVETSCNFLKQLSPVNNKVGSPSGNDTFSLQEATSSSDIESYGYDENSSLLGVPYKMPLFTPERQKEPYEDHNRLVMENCGSKQPASPGTLPTSCDLLKEDTEPYILQHPVASPSEDAFHAERTTPSPLQIEINEAKLKLMENIVLYEDERIDSSQLFDS